MSIQMVNGYSCTNCAEASLAKRGIDPHESKTANTVSAISGVESAGGVRGKNTESDTLVPRAVESSHGSADVRARLDYAQNVDRLI